MIDGFFSVIIKNLALLGFNKLEVSCTFSYEILHLIFLHEDHPDSNADNIVLVSS